MCGKMCSLLAEMVFSSAAARNGFVCPVCLSTARPSDLVALPCWQFVSSCVSWAFRARAPVSTAEGEYSPLPARIPPRKVNRLPERVYNRAGEARQASLVSRLGLRYSCRSLHLPIKQPNKWTKATRGCCACITTCIRNSTQDLRRALTRSLAAPLLLLSQLHGLQSSHQARHFGSPHLLEACTTTSHNASP